MSSLRLPNGISFSKQALIGFTFFFIPLLLVDFGFTGLEIGILMAVFPVMQLFSSFPIGAINDRLSIKYVMIAGMLLESAYFAGLALFSGFWAVLFFFALGGLGGNMFDTSVRSLNFKALGDGKKGRMLGIFQVATTGGFGTGILLGGLLLNRFAFGWVLLLSSAAMLVLALASWVIADVERIRFPIREYRELILRKSTALFLFPLFLFGLHWGAEHTSYSLFLTHNLGLDYFWMGLYMGIPVIMLAAISYYTGLRIDRKGSHHRAAFFAGILLSGAGHILMTIPPAPVSFIFRIVHEVGDGMAAVSYNLSFSKIFKVERIAGETGAAYTVILLGNIVGALAFGPLGSSAGYQWPLIISGAISIASLAVLYPASRKVGF